MAKSRTYQIHSMVVKSEPLPSMQRKRKADLRNPTKVVIRKSINVTHQMGRSKENTQMNLSIDSQKALAKFSNNS